MTSYFTGFGEDVTQFVRDLINELEDVKTENAELKLRVGDLSRALAKARRRRRPVVEIPSISEAG